MRKTIPAERFCSKVNIGRLDECWEWTGSKDTGGYAQLLVGGKTKKASRLVYEWHHGEIPDMDGYHGACVMHTCDNRACVNPMHLTLGSHQDNMADMSRKGRNGVKLTPDDIVSIRRDDRPQVEIAADYGVDQSNISKIKHGHIWRNA